MSLAMSTVLDRMSKFSKEEKISAAPIFVSGGSFYWRGFTSPVGSVRRPTPATQNIRGGRSGRGRASSGFGGSFGSGTRNRGGHGGTPYDRFSKN
jgi:hypothetical protein